MIAYFHLKPRVSRDEFDGDFHLVPLRVAVVVEMLHMLVQAFQHVVGHLLNVHLANAVVVEDQTGNRLQNMVVVNFNLGLDRVDEPSKHSLVRVVFVQIVNRFESAQCDYDDALYEHVKSESEESSG